MARKKPPRHDDERWIWQLAPAPGELRIVHAFVKTAEGGEGLSSPGVLSHWLALWGLLPAAIELKAVDLERMLEIRSALRAIIGANSGGPLDPAAVEQLDQALAKTSFRLRVAAGGALRYEPFADDCTSVDGALAKLLAIVERHREAGWRRLKRCDAEDCGRVYHDFSRSICGKWCSTRCGNKLSARGYRRRYKHRHGMTPGARLRSS